MSGTAFFLAVNFIVALSFSIVFGVVSTRSRSRTATLWLAAGFAVASLSAICELLVAYTDLSKLWAIGAFASVLAGMILLRIGIGDLYGRRVDLRYAGLFLVGGIGVDLLIYDLPRGTLLHAFSYQTPFAVVILSSGVAVFVSGRKLLIDRVLGGLLLVTGLHFFGKAALAVVVGSGSTAKDYINTNYALISQSSTAVLVVGVGLTLLSVLVLEIMADERSNSEKDALSGLANRRGFEAGVRKILERESNAAHAVIICDLDHFKSINDTYGHHAGDLVIRAFGDLLLSTAPCNTILGRIGGEEFALFLPGTTLEMAALLAQTLRNGTVAMEVGVLPASYSVTASFGVAGVPSGQDLSDAMRNADGALYEAKRSGRNCVKLAGSPDIPGWPAIKAVK